MTEKWPVKPGDKAAGAPGKASACWWKAQLPPERGLHSRPPEVDTVPAAAVEDEASSTWGKDAITEVLALVLTVQPLNQCHCRHHTDCY